MLKKQVLRFKIGDWIVHTSYGVGKVVDILDKDMDGHQETYFKVSTEEIEYWLPVDKADAEHITPIRSEKDFNQAIQIISKPPKPMSEPRNQYKRLINERWLDGSLPARAALIRDLNGRNAIKRLSYDEKETCNKAENSFIEEWIITVPSLSKPMARKRLNDALQISIQRGNLEVE
jgi:RNA polymerase-interacting CarD/CdnL/TRCF family regulator